MPGLAKGICLALALAAFSGPALAKIEPEASRAYYEQAQKYVAEEDLRAAVIELKNALQRDPQNGDARLLLGEVYVRLGDGGAAEKELRAARRYGIAAERTAVPLARAVILQGRLDEALLELNEAADKQAPEVALLRAEAVAGLGRLEEARRGYEAIVRNHPDEARAYLGLARLDLAAKQFEAAESEAEAALERDPELREAQLVKAEARRLGGDVEGSLALYRAAAGGAANTGAQLRAQLGLASALIALNRDADAEAELQAITVDVPLVAYLRALIKLRAQDYQGARQILDRAAPALDNFAPAQFLFGIVYFASDELETARSWLTRHLQAQPGNLQARKILAATLLRLNALPDAVEVLEKGLAQAPDDPQVLMLLGNAYLRSGRSAEANELLQRAAADAPDDPRVFSQLAVSHLATGDYDESLAALSTSLDLDAGASTLGYALAFVHLRRGDYPEALKVAQELRKRFPGSAVAANLEGGAYAALGQLDKAQESFEAVLEIEPDFYQARTNLAALKAQKGDIDGAEAEYRRVLDSEPGQPQALLGMAAVARYRKDAAASREWLEKAVDANPAAPQPSFALAELHLSGGDKEAAARVLAAFARQETRDPRVLARLGSLQAQAGRPAEAVDTFRRLVRLTNGGAEARLLLARAEVASGDAAAARRELEGSLEAQPDHQPTAEALVQVVAQLESPEETLAYAERLQRRHPDAAWGPKILGDQQQRAGQAEAALKTYEKGWEKQPTADLALALYQLRRQLGHGKAALASLQDWLADNPDDVRVHLVLAEGLLGFGEMAEARKSYEALKQTQANNAIVWNNLAWLYQQAGDTGAAVSHGERALALAPGQPAIMDTLGWILLDAGEDARAAELLRQAAAAAPGNADITYHYAVALHRTGDDAAAKDVLQGLLASDKVFADKDEAAALLQKISQ